MVGAVLSWLPAEAVLSCGLVCRAWHHVALDDVLWRRLIDRDLGPAIQRDRGADELSMMATYFLRLRDTSVAVPLWGASGCGKTTLFDLVEDAVAMAEQLGQTLSVVPPQGDHGAHALEVNRVMALAREAKRVPRYPTAPYRLCTRDYRLGKREVHLRGLSLRAVLVDLPGHVDYVKNALAGAFGASCAIVMVAADNSEFGMGLRWTKEHILTAYLQGCRSLVVAVNKMEQTVWSESHFDEIRHQVLNICKRTGYASDRVRFVPISVSIEGDNVFVQTKHMHGWYTGPTLLQALGDVVQALPMRAAANLHRQMALTRKPLCLVVHQCRRMGKQSGDNTRRLLEVSVAQGRLSVGDKLALPILGLEGLEVLSMMRCRKAITTARAPFDRVSLAVRLVDHPSQAKTSAGYLIQAKYLRRGAVLTKVLGQADDKSQPPPPLRRVQSLVAEVIVFNHPNGIRHGYMPTVWFHTLNVRCSIRLLTKLDRKTHQVIEERPTIVKNNEACLVEMVPHRPLSTAVFGELSSVQLGSFLLRDMKATIGGGVVRSIVWADDDKETSLFARLLAEPRALSSLRVPITTTASGLLTITVVRAMIRMSSPWTPEGVSVKLSIESEDNAHVLVWSDQTRSVGETLAPIFEQSFTVEDVNPVGLRLRIELVDAAGRSDMGSRTVRLSPLAQTNLPHSHASSIGGYYTIADPTRYSNSVVVNIHWRALR